MCVCTHASGRVHLFLVQLLKVVHTCAFVHMLRDVYTCFWCKYRPFMCVCTHAWGHVHLFLVQVLKVVHTCAFVHMLGDVIGIGVTVL